MANFDRSLAFTALLELSDEFGYQDTDTGGKIITDLLADYYTDEPMQNVSLWTYTERWLGEHPISQSGHVQYVKEVERVDALVIALNDPDQ